MPTVKRDLFTPRKKVAEKIAPFPRRTPAVKGRITAGDRVNRHPAYRRDGFIAAPNLYRIARERSSATLRYIARASFDEKTYWHGNTPGR